MRNENSPSKVISVSLDRETLEILDDMTCCSGKSRSSIIRYAIRDLYDEVGGDNNENE